MTADDCDAEQQCKRVDAQNAGIHDKQDKVLAVAASYACVDPGAVVIHVLHTAATDTEAKICSGEARRQGTGCE